MSHGDPEPFPPTSAEQPASSDESSASVVGDVIPFG